MNNHVVFYRGDRPDGTVLFMHSGTYPDAPVYVSVVRNNTWKESKAYYVEEQAMEVVNKAWPDVTWRKIKTVDFVKFVIKHDSVVHQDDYVANTIANYFDKIYDIEEVDERLDFQMDGEFYSVEFGYVHEDEQWAELYNIPEKYNYWQFYKDNGEELVLLRWEC